MKTEKGIDIRLTAQQQRIKNQIEAVYGFYGVRYNKATSRKEKENIVQKALGLFNN